MSFRLPASFGPLLIIAWSSLSGGCIVTVEMAEEAAPLDTSVADAGLSGDDAGLPDGAADTDDASSDPDVLSDASSDATVLPDASSDAAVLPDLSPSDAPDAATLESLEPLVREIVGPLVGDDDPNLAVGAVVALVTPQGTQVVGLGTRERGGAAVDAETTFQIGSVTKVFTGLLLATLAERPGGPVAAEDPVNDHLIDVVAPEFEGQAITLEHLATHYSALDNMPSNMTGPRLSPARDYSRDMLATYLSQAHLERAPGASYAYSNLGSGLLGVALADAAGRSDYDALLTAELLGPLGLSRTGTNTDAMWALAADNVARGYNLANGVQTAVDYADMGVLAGGGEAISTGADMALFVEVMTGLRPHPVAGAVERAVVSRGPGEGDLQIGYGWNIAAGGTTHEKAGLTAGFSAFVVLKRAPQIGVVILSNRSAHRDIGDAARTLADRLAAQEDAVVEPLPLEPSPVVCDEVAGELEIVVMVASFDDEAAACTVEDLRETWLTGEPSVATFYAAASGQRLSVGGDVVGPLVIPSPDGCISLDPVQNRIVQQALYERIDAAAEAAGHDIPAAATRVYVVPDSIRCEERTPRGAGLPSWNRIFLYGDVCENARISAHELGHILGLNHASSLDASTGEVRDVGDPSDVMGNGLFPLNGPHVAQLGWLPRENAVTISAPGRYRLAPLSAEHAAHQLLVIDSHSDDTKAYFLSFRGGAGFDSELPPEILDRTSVHEFWSGCTVGDPRPAPKTLLLGTVGDGEELSFAEGAISIRQLSHGDAGALLEVQLPAEWR